MHFSPHARFASRQAFSLFEIVIVLGIVALIFGSAFFMASAPREEKRIREAHGAIEDLAQQAWVLSSNYQQTFVLEITDGAVAMRPEATPEHVVEAEPETEQSGGLRRLDSFVWPRTAQIDPDYQISILRWGQKNPILIEDDHIERIYFPPGGPYEPIVIQLTSGDGKALLSRRYHPLTAVAEDEELSIESSGK